MALTSPHFLLCSPGTEHNQRVASCPHCLHQIHDNFPDDGPAHVATVAAHRPRHNSFVNNVTLPRHESCAVAVVNNNMVPVQSPPGPPVDAINVDNINQGQEEVKENEVIDMSAEASDDNQVDVGVDHDADTIQGGNFNQCEMDASFVAVGDDDEEDVNESMDEGGADGQGQSAANNNEDDNESTSTTSETTNGVAKMPTPLKDSCGPPESSCDNLQQQMATNERYDGNDGGGGKPDPSYKTAPDTGIQRSSSDVDGAADMMKELNSPTTTKDCPLVEGSHDGTTLVASQEQHSSRINGSHDETPFVDQGCETSAVVTASQTRNRETSEATTTNVDARVPKSPSSSPNKKKRSTSLGKNNRFVGVKQTSLNVSKFELSATARSDSVMPPVGPIDDDNDDDVDMKDASSHKHDGSLVSVVFSSFFVVRQILTCFFGSSKMLLSFHTNKAALHVFCSPMLAKGGHRSKSR